MKNTNLSHLDTNQIVKRTFDESEDAQRVTVVGQSLNLNISVEDIKEALKNGLKDIKIESSSPGIIFPEWPKTIDNTVFIPQVQVVETEKTVHVPQIVQVEKIVYVPEYRTIEIPVIQKVIEYKEIEKSIFVPQVQVVEIEKKNSKWTTILTVIQTVALLILSLSQFIKK